MNEERFCIYSYDKSDDEIYLADNTNDKQRAIEIASEPIEETVLIFDTRGRVAFVIGSCMDEVKNCTNRSCPEYSKNRADYLQYEWRHTELDQLETVIKD